MKIKEAAEKAQKEAEKESDTESVHLSDNSSDEESEDYSGSILEENNLYAFQERGRVKKKPKKNHYSAEVIVEIKDNKVKQFP